MKGRVNQFAFLVYISLFLMPTASAADLTELTPATASAQGIAAYNKADYQTAVKFLNWRVRQKPEDPNAYYYLGNSYLQLKQHDQAAHMFSACVRVSPASQAGKYSLTALESLSAMPKAVPEEPNEKDLPPDAAQTAAARDALMSGKALDRSFNEAVQTIKGRRQTLKTTVDHAFQHMQDEMQAMNARNTPNYATELEKLQREAESKVQDAQNRELRIENRLLGPDKIDVRAVPSPPGEKADDTKTALGSLLSYFKPEKPFDPFGTDITPDVTSKFMTINDVFGELSTYQPSARRLARQVFFQLKGGIETKQDVLDQQLYQVKQNLIRDIVSIKNNYGNTASTKMQQITASSFISGASIPRADNENHLTPMEQEVSQAVERSKKRIKEIEDGYYRDVDSLLAGAKEKLGGMIAQTGQMNSQLKRPSGIIQMVPQGTDTYTKNYVNFAERPDISPANNFKFPAQPAQAAQPVQPLRAPDARKISPKAAQKKEAAK